MKNPRSKIGNDPQREGNQQDSKARREPEPDGQLGEGADRETQVDQREKEIPDDGMLGSDVSR